MLDVPLTLAPGRTALLVLVVVATLAAPSRGLGEPTERLPDDVRKIVFLAGERDTHPEGTHEYECASRLLAGLVESAAADWGTAKIRTEVHVGGWPRDPSTLEDADAIVLISAGADLDETMHPLLHGDRLQVVGEQMARGAGLVVLHWGVFVPIQRGGLEFLEWIGGFFDYESGPPEGEWYSAIQTLTSEVTLPAPDHPIVREVAPFELHEEFYYRIRFRPDDPRFTPILQTRIPGEEGPQTIAWAVDRTDGGRGFGFTGGHFYDNFLVEPLQRVLVNAILWSAHGELPGGPHP